MSHFTVAVFTDGNKTVEELLAPFHEFECTGNNDEYVQDVDITKELAEMIKGGDSVSEVLEDYGLDDKIVALESEIDTNDTHKYGYAIVQDGNLIKAVNRTNPNKKWDWWQVGGRWRNFLLTKDGIKCDFAKTCDIDFKALEEKRKSDKIAAWNNYHADIAGKSHNEFLRSHIYGIPKEIETLEQYMALPIAPFSTYAAISPDGIWHAPGKMGWFGVSSDSKDESATFKALFHEKLIIPAIENDWTITIIDCHI